MKRFAGIAVVLGLIGLAATALLLWWLPADDFLFVPDRAKPLADKVEVQGGRTNAKGDVYYVDLFVRRIRKLEQLLPFTRPDGSTLVSEDRLTPDGTSDAERDRQNAEDMKRSEQIAAVVALRALGYHVTATPRGVLVTAVYSDVPAAKVLDPNDVIVAVNGVPVRTPAQLRREIGRIDPGDDVRLSVRRDGKAMDVTVRTDSEPGTTRRAPSSASSSTRTRRSSCPSTSISTSVASAALRPGFRSPSRSPASSAATSPTAAGSRRPARSRWTAP